jgi:hypothetical protein
VKGPQALVSFKKYMPPPLPYFKVNICPLPLPHFASIFFAYLWSFHWPNYIVTLPRYFSFRLPRLNINTGAPSDELDKNIQRKSHFLTDAHKQDSQKMLPVPVCNHSDETNYNTCAFISNHYLWVVIETFNKWKGLTGLDYVPIFTWPSRA